MGKVQRVFYRKKEIRMIDYVGQQFGNYRSLRLLEEGEGNFRQIYLGQHISLSTYATIQFSVEDMNSIQAKAFRAAFLQEAQRIAALKHPHILPVQDFGISTVKQPHLLQTLGFGRETLTPYVVMEYVSYGTLLDRYPRGTKVAINEVVSYTRQIAKASQAT
jgi:serine/threonine protein kinase